MVDVMSRLVRIRQGLTSTEWTKVAGMTLTIVVLNVAGWSMLAAASGHFHVSKGEVFGFGTGILAYTLGMRHAFDADHIAAIDNTTRSMMAEGKRPLSVGFFFSLGHSSVVFALTTLLALGVRGLGTQLTDEHSSLHQVTGVVGTSVSGVFLLLIAAINIVIFRSIVSAFSDLRRGQYNEEEIEQRLAQRGFMNRILAPAVKRVDSPWKMYPLGLLFGLGFDTATEVGLLVLSGSAIASGLPLWAIFSLPLLFAGGMSLLDTIVGCFMIFAYGWAFSRPVRKIYYNLVITGLSIAVAVLIGTIEVAGLLVTHLNLHGGVFDLISSIDLNTAGFVVVGLFVVTWIVALVVWRVGRLEERFNHRAD